MQRFRIKRVLLIKPKYMKALLSTLCLALLFSSFTGKACSSITINISNLQENRQVRNFNGVAAGGSMRVIIKMGNTESLRLEGNKEAIAELITEVKEGILVIKPRTKWNDWNRKYNNAKITAYVTAKNITSLTMSGSGTMSVENRIEASELVATLSGSGSIRGAANVQSFVGVISGSGSLNFNGKADESNITLSGSGSFEGKEFTVQDFSTQISGSGSVNIHAEDSIEAVISGSGNVNYSGNASVEKTTVGSGRVRKI